MKRLTALVLCLVLAIGAMGCGGAGTNTGNVGEVSGQQGADLSDKDSASDKGASSVEASDEILEMLGMSQEQWAAMDPAKQEALMAEMGAIIEQGKKEEQTPQQTQSASKTYTPDDVMAGGNYTVVLGDYMNSITLYYENGKLVKLVEEFQKNSEEEAYGDTYEGDSLAEYTFNFIDWASASLQEILDGMKDYGGFGEYRIKKTN